MSPKTPVFLRPLIVLLAPLITACSVTLPPAEQSDPTSAAPAPDTSLSSGANNGQADSPDACLDADGCRPTGLDERPADDQAPASAVDPNAQGEQFDYTVEQYVGYIVADVDRVWSAYFTANGWQEPETFVHLIAPGETLTLQDCYNGTPVSYTADTPNAYYCNRDVVTDTNGHVWRGSVVLPLSTMQGMWTGRMFSDQLQSKVRGDFAAAIIVAHEYGHSIQDEFYLQSQAAGNTAVTVPRPPYQELIADCFAGVWMATAYSDGVLTDTDYYEAVAAIETIGDSEGTDQNHGTAQQRRDALLTGYNSGSGATVQPEACIATYWK